jgi:hypothetical protein
MGLPYSSEHKELRSSYHWHGINGGTSVPRLARCIRLQITNWPQQNGAPVAKPNKAPWAAKYQQTANHIQVETQNTSSSCMRHSQQRHKLNTMRTPQLVERLGLSWSKQRALQPHYDITYCTCAAPSAFKLADLAILHWVKQRITICTAHVMPFDHNRQSQYRKHLCCTICIIGHHGPQA